MFRKFPTSSPGPKWEALQEPDPSSDDELDAEDGEVNTLLQPGSAEARVNTKRFRDGRTEVTRDPPQSVLPAFASTSTVVGDNSRSQMKRKEPESLFTSKKRARYVQAVHSDQDDAMDLDLDEHAKNKRNMGVSSKSTPVQKTMGGLGGKQPEAPLSVPSMTMNKKQPLGDSSTPSTSTSAKPTFMKPAPFLPKHPSESAVVEINRRATLDPPSKLAGLPFDNYKRTESKTVPASDSGHSMVPASPVDKPADKGKALLKHRVSSVPQTMCRPSTSKTKVIPPDAEIIEISEDDDIPPKSTSKAKAKVKAKAKSIKSSFFETLSAPEQAGQRSGITSKPIASSSVPSLATKKFLPKAPIEVIEILDSDEEQLPPKAQLLQQKNVGTSPSSRLSELVQECATGWNPRRGQSRHMSSLGGDSFENSENVDGMDVDEARNLLQPASAVPAIGPAHSITSDSDNYPDDLFDIPSSPRASSQEIQVNDDAAKLALIPLPSSSPSSIGLSPKHTSLSTPPAPTTSIASLLRSSLSQQPSTPMNTNSVRKPVAINGSAGSSTGGNSNRLGFSSVATSSSLQAPPPADKHSKQFARKMSSLAPQSMSDQDEDSGEDSSESSEKGAVAQTKMNKGKEKEIHQSSSSSSGAESINMRGLRDALTMDSDKPVKLQLVSPLQLPKEGQTLAEAITSAGQLNRTRKKTGRRLQGNTKNVPIDLTSDVEGGVKDGPTLDENEKALKAAIGSSRLLVNFLPTLREKKGASKVTEPLAPSSQDRKPSLSQPRTQDFHSTVEPAESPSTKIERSSYPLPTLPPKRDIIPHDMPSPKPSPSMQLKSKPSVGKTFSATNATAQPQTEQPTAFEFRSGTAVIGPPKRIPLPKRPSTATIEKMLAAGNDSSGASQQTSSSIGTIGLIGETGESGGDVLMADVSSRKLISPTLANTLATSPSAAAPAKPFKRLTPPRRSPLAAIETSVASSVPGDGDGSTSSGPTHSTSADGRSLGGENNTVASRTIVATEKSPQSPEPPMTSISAPHPTAASNSIARDTASEAIPLPKTPLSMRPSPSLPTDAAPEDRSFDLLPDILRDDDEEECQALLQSPSDNMDVVASHEDSIVVRHKAQITPVASSSALTSISGTPEVFNEHISVSPPVPEVPLRRSSRRSSRSSNSEGLGTAFDDDFGPFDSVPATRTPTPEDQEPSASSSPPGSPKTGFKTYGGFRALTWKDFRKDLNNFTPKIYYANDLPHALQDHINSMSDITQKMSGMRDLFMATILENTVEDEPDAPPIEIVNDVDAQATPPWEFYYTNHMWLGEGVPPPDIKSLVSCTCKGGCNPKSKTCACLLRQKEVASDSQLEFAYDKNGKLKIPGYPIFECNDLCGCSDECRNRVVQHGRKVSVNIKKTESKGWGVFAGTKRIPGGTFVGIYSGELLTDAVAHERGVKYNKFGRTYLFDIDFHHLKDGDRRWENNFTVDAYHAGNFTRFLNHSCDPNCRLYACYINEGNIQKPLLAIFSRRDIEPNEEICFNYQGIYPDNDDDDSDDDDDDDRIAADPDHGKDNIYVPCRCGAKNCTGTMFK